MTDASRIPAIGSAASTAPPLGMSLEQFLESLWSGIVLVNDAGIVVSANPLALDIMGLVKTAAIGRPVTGAFRQCYDRGRQQSPTGDFFAFEKYFQSKWYLVQCNTIRPTDSGEILTMVSMTDISPRKKREFEMLENIAGLEEATRIARMGTFRVNNVADTVEWSPHTYTLHGVTPDRFKPTIYNYQDLVLPEDRPLVKSQMERMEVQRSRGGFEYRIVRPDGAVRWVYLDRRVLFDTDGEPLGTFGTVQDITETKNREQELRQLLLRNAILYEALEASPIGVAVIGTANERPEVIYVNTAFEKLTLYKSIALDQAGIMSLAGESSRDAWTEVLDAFNASNSLSIEAECRRKDGTDFPARIEVAPVRDHPGRPATNFVVNVRDLTEERKRAEALLQTQKMLALGQLSGGVAHEINNLLQPVIALSDLGLSVVDADPAKAKQYLEVIGGSGRKAREIVRQVLTFARRDSPQLSRLDLVPLVFDAVNLAQKGLPLGIELRAAIDVTSIYAEVNATQVSQVVLNLIRNAADAISGGGPIDVELTMAGLDKIQADKIGISAGRWVRLSVTDCGCGMSEETRRRVFEPFFTTKPVGKGTGLGLSVVYSIVTGWGGTVTIDSQVDVGTRVMIYIPLSNQVQTAPA